MKKIKQMIRIGLLVSVLALTAFISGSPLAAAEAYNDFTISAVLPSNQIDASVSYFDLRVSRQQVQELQVEIKNDGDQTMLATVELNSARTGNNATKIYTDKGENDASLKYPITSMATVLDPTITVAAHTTVIARVQLTIPDVEITGDILGGIVVRATTDSESQSTGSEENINIENQVAYVLGLKLSMNDTVVKPNLNLMGVQAQLVDYRTSVTARLQNDQARIMNGVLIEGEIYKKDSSTALTEVMIPEGQISPNTNFDVVFDWNGKKIDAGTYRLHLRAEYEGEVWEWDETFEVTDSEAADVNDDSFFVEEDNTLLLILLGAGGMLLILGLGWLIFFLWKKRKKEETEK